MTKQEVKYSFVIDTEEYAGNFERELVGYMTGGIGEDGHGRKESKTFEEEEGLDKALDFRDKIADSRICDPGDDGIARDFYDIWPTPGWFNHAGQHYRDGDTSPLLAQSASEHKDFARYPAYLSVAIFLREKPSEEQMKFWFERAKKFSVLPKEKPWDHRPKITGCRLVKTIIQTVDVDMWNSKA